MASSTWPSEMIGQGGWKVRRPQCQLADRAVFRLRDEVGVQYRRPADHRGQPVRLVDGDRRRLRRHPPVGSRAAPPRRYRTPPSRSGHHAPCRRASAPPPPVTATDPGFVHRRSARDCGVAGVLREHRRRTPPRSGTGASRRPSSPPRTRPVMASGRSSSAVSPPRRSTPCQESGRTPAGTFPVRAGDTDNDTHATSRPPAISVVAMARRMPLHLISAQS